MDSMRSLNTSLPRSPRKKRSAQPPEQLIQAFKTAALQVTNLYKTAATDQKRARETGYQDALDDLLTFLDRENIGLDDGEGWRIRQWATERLDGSPPAATVSDSEEDRAEDPKRARSSSPAVQQATEVHQPSQASRSRSPMPPPAAPTSTPTSGAAPSVNIQPPSESFSFRSAHPYPQEIEMQASDSTNNTQNPSSPQLQAQTLPASAVRVEVVPRGSRTTHRSGNHSSRHGPRSTPSTRLPTSITGSKRRLPFGDYFDIGSLGDGRDSQGGGGKRGRFM